MTLHHAPARLFKISDQPAGQHCRKFRIDQVIRVQNGTALQFVGFLIQQRMATFTGQCQTR